jgi:rare lipoprotein A
MRTVLVLLALILVLGGCGKKKVKARHGHAGRSSSPAPPPVIGSSEKGIASWYGHPYHGRQAANGEIYDMEKMTAAHRTLPFNTWVRVENLNNGKTVDLRITDRGPFIDGRIIDISHAAAQQIEMIGPGVANVRVVIIAAPAVVEAAVFAVQVGLFRNRDNADRLQQQMKERYGAARVVEREGTVPNWRVLAGEENTPESAEALAVRIRSDISVPEAFVVRVDKP